MKSLFCAFCLIISTAIGWGEQETQPNFPQLCTLVDGAVVSNILAEVGVVIVPDVSVRDKLSKHYSKSNVELKFESENGIEQNRSGYIHIPSRKTACVSWFKLISSDKDKCVIKWSLAYGTWAGFTKEVVMSYADGKWKIVDIKLKSTL